MTNTIIIVLIFFSLFLVQICWADGMPQEYTSFKQPVMRQPSSGLKDAELAKFQGCFKDIDCAYVKNGCESCGKGVQFVAVNKTLLSEFQRKLGCENVICDIRRSDPECAEGVVSCVNEKCHYYKLEQVTFLHR